MIHETGKCTGEDQTTSSPLFSLGVVKRVTHARAREKCFSRGEAGRKASRFLAGENFLASSSGSLAVLSLRKIRDCSYSRGRLMPDLPPPRLHRGIQCSKCLTNGNSRTRLISKCHELWMHPMTYVVSSFVFFFSYRLLDVL